jgi:hypothetical protein
MMMKRKLLSVGALSDFEIGRDKVIRDGNRTFVVDTQGAKKRVQVVSDVCTPEIEASMRKLPRERLREFRQLTLQTPYLSSEGKAERLRVFDELLAKL